MAHQFKCCIFPDLNFLNRFAKLNERSRVRCPVTVIVKGGKKGVRFFSLTQLSVQMPPTPSLPKIETWTALLFLVLYYIEQR